MTEYADLYKRISFWAPGVYSDAWSCLLGVRWLPYHLGFLNGKRPFRGASFIL